MKPQIDSVELKNDGFKLEWFEERKNLSFDAIMNELGFQERLIAIDLGEYIIWRNPLSAVLLKVRSFYKSILVGKDWKLYERKVFGGGDISY